MPAEERPESVVGSEGDAVAEEEGETITPEDTNIALHCVYKDDLERFLKCFDDEEDAFHEAVNEQVNERDEFGKSPLELAAILGRITMIKELAARGAEVNAVTVKGYTALHQAAAWGKIDCLKELVNNGADLQLRTSNNERARELAFRYNKTECVDYLDWAEAKQHLIDTYTKLRETVQDPEKVQGRLNRDDKNQANAMCNEKEQWVENTIDATTQDFIVAKETFIEQAAPIWQKLTEPLPEKPEKK